MKKFFLLLAITTLFTGCGTPNDSPANDSQEMGTITMAVLPSLDGLPIFIAYEMGFFEDHGVNVELERFSAARDRDMAFQATDHIDGLVFDGIALAIYNSAGFDMVAVSSALGLASVIGGEGIETLDDLYGSTILISRNTAMDYILDRTLLAAGLLHDNVIIEEVPSLPTRLEMLLNGQAEAATLPEPFATIAMLSGLNRVTYTHELGINPFIYSFRREVVEQRPEEVRAFFKGINSAVDFMNNAPRDEFVDILIDIVGYPEDTRDTLILPQFVHFTVPNAERIQDVLNFSRDRGLLTVDIAAEDIIVDVFN